MPRLIDALDYIGDLNLQILVLAPAALRARVLRPTVSGPKRPRSDYFGRKKRNPKEFGKSGLEGCMCGHSNRKE